MKKCQYAVSGKLQKEGKKLSPARVEEDECLSGNEWGFVGCSKFPNSKLDKKVRLEGRCKSTPEALGITDMILLSVRLQFAIPIYFHLLL
ncbi:hypothetical protein Bca4012_094439 [Brassica carinata]